jgi:hypothetical protein
MYGSSDRYRVRISTWPSPGSATGSVTIEKFPAVGLPTGRDASRIWVFCSAMGAAYATITRVRCPRPAPGRSSFADGVVGYPYCIPVSWESDDWALPRVPPWPTSIVTRLRLCRPTATSTTEPGRMPEAQMEQLVS